MYHYLTGSASWLVLTQLTQVFGVRGLWGDLILDPKLVREEFDSAGSAGVSFTFAGKNFQLTYQNSQRVDHGRYRARQVTLNGRPLSFTHAPGGAVRILKSALKAPGKLRVVLG